MELNVSIKELIPAIGLMLTALSAAYAACRFSIEQRWRTKLTALERVDALYKDWKIRNALYAIGWINKGLYLTKLMKYLSDRRLWFALKKKY